jgi:hypothetical protein
MKIDTGRKEWSLGAYTIRQQEEVLQMENWALGLKPNLAPPHGKKPNDVSK